MDIEGESIQIAIPTPDKPIEIINVFKDINFAKGILELIRDKEYALYNADDKEEYKIPRLNDMERQAITTVLYKLSEQDTEINKLNKELDITKTNYEILQGEMDRIGIDTLHLEAGSSTDDVIDEINKLNNVIDKQQKEIKQLKEDISNMYDEKIVRNILEDECGLSKYEIDEILN